MHDLNMKRLAVAFFIFIRSREETHANCRTSKQLTDQKCNALHATLISVNSTGSDIQRVKRVNVNQRTYTSIDVF